VIEVRGETRARAERADRPHDQTAAAVPRGGTCGCFCATGRERSSLTTRDRGRRTGTSADFPLKARRMGDMSTRRHQRHMFFLSFLPQTGRIWIEVQERLRRLLVYRDSTE